MLDKHPNTSKCWSLFNHLSEKQSCKTSLETKQWWQYTKFHPNQLRNLQEKQVYKLSLSHTAMTFNDSQGHSNW